MARHDPHLPHGDGAGHRVPAWHRPLDWLAACWYDAKESWCRFWVADEETSRLLDLMDQQETLREAQRKLDKRLRP